MTNRVAQYFEQPASGGEDFWRVVTEQGWILVDEDTARRILVVIERPFGRRWVRFRDLFGDRICLKTRRIVSVEESTVTARQLGWVFQQRLRDEQPGSDRPWEDC